MNMQAKAFLLIFSFGSSIFLLYGSLKKAQIYCQKSIQIVFPFQKNSSYLPISHATACLGENLESFESPNCWQPGDLLSQRRYCLERSLLPIGDSYH